MGGRPFSEAAERNRAPILERLMAVLTEPGELLEVGSGTGQHAAYFAARLPQLIWHASDRPENHDGIRAWLDWAQLPNLRGPHALDVAQAHWPLSSLDATYSANTAHIMHWWQVERMFAGVGQRLRPEAPFCLYGPFARGGEHNSDSNRAFDASLRARDAGMGIRDLDDLEALGRQTQLRLDAEYPMPANNRLLLFRRTL